LSSFLDQIKKKKRKEQKGKKGVEEEKERKRKKGIDEMKFEGPTQKRRGRVHKITTIIMTLNEI